jgi:hypothetical protein
MDNIKIDLRDIRYKNGEFVEVTQEHSQWLWYSRCQVLLQKG